MVEQMRQSWREFAESRPGERFKDRYRRRRQDEQGHIIWRIFLITLGAVIALGSLILAPLPGPGWATVFVGLMILAGELLPAARFLDCSRCDSEISGGPSSRCGRLRSRARSR